MWVAGGLCVTSSARKFCMTFNPCSTLKVSSLMVPRGVLTLIFLLRSALPSFLSFVRGCRRAAAVPMMMSAAVSVAVSSKPKTFLQT